MCASHAYQQSLTAEVYPGWDTNLVYSQLELNGTSKYSPDDGICGQQYLKKCHVAAAKSRHVKCISSCTQPYGTPNCTVRLVGCTAPKHVASAYTTLHIRPKKPRFKENGSLIGSRTGTAKICQLRKPNVLNGGQQWEESCTCDKCITWLWYVGIIA
jgi:hypothetical protein